MKEPKEPYTPELDKLDGMTARYTDVTSIIETMYEAGFSIEDPDGESLRSHEVDHVVLIALGLDPEAIRREREATMDYLANFGQYLED